MKEKPTIATMDKIRAIKDQDIAEDADNPVMGEDFWRDAELVLPPKEREPDGVSRRRRGR
jgi:hypothetical protein